MNAKLDAFRLEIVYFGKGWRKKHQQRQIQPDHGLSRETMAKTRMMARNPGIYCKFVSAVNNGDCPIAGNAGRDDERHPIS